jgi:hypothetical protein
MYSWLCMGVKRGLVVACLLPTALGAQGDPVCDPTLAALWTPAHPQLGRYEVCTTSRPLTEIAGPGWEVETVPPLDAFGTAGAFDKATVARLYGGRWPTVARRWIAGNGRFEAITLVSPYPNRQLTALEPGTLIIRYFVVE